MTKKCKELEEKRQIIGFPIRPPFIMWVCHDFTRRYAKFWICNSIRQHFLFFPRPKKPKRLYIQAMLPIYVNIFV